MAIKNLVVLALGGNAILEPGKSGSVFEQQKKVKATCHSIANIINKGYQLVITHGNGPQVGNLLIQNEVAKEIIPPMPLDVCVSQTQGFIGYMLQQALGIELRRLNLQKEVASLVTQIIVDSNDLAFTNPTKPIGPFYTEEEARIYMKNDTVFKEDSGRGWRRVVPSPTPKSIVEINTIKKHISYGDIVICCGGGGIPVIWDKIHKSLQGIEAVIDKDLAAKLLAQSLNADVLMILTDIDHVYINYRKENQQKLRCITAIEGRRLLEEGQFSAGSMAPKMEAAVSFVENGGKKAIITSLEHALKALEGEIGTQII